MDNKDLYEELETERLILRKITDDDAKDLYDNIYNNYDYYKYYYQEEFKSFDEYKEIVSKYKEWYQNGNHFRWGVYLKNEDKTIGVIQLHSKDSLNNKCKLSYIVGYNYQDKGYINEACIKVIEFGFNKLNYHKIETEIVPENIKSINVAEKLNMNYECSKKDDYKLKDKYYDQDIYYLINED